MPSPAPPSPRPPRVCLLREDGAVGGVNTVIDALCAGLQQRGWHHLDVQSLRGGHPAQWWRAARDCDVLVATNAFRTAHVARLLGAVLRKPVVTWVHGPLQEVLGAAQASRLQRARLRWLYRGMPRFVFVSDHARASMEAFVGQRLGPPRASTIRNAAPPARAMACRPALRPDAVVEMGCVGRLSPEKEPARLIDMLRCLPPRFRLTLVGDGPLRGLLQAQGADLVAQQRLVFAGERPREQALSPDWRITVLSSRYEGGTPLSALESAAAGIPFVAPPLPAIVETAQGPAACLVTQDGSPQALASAVQRVLALPSEHRQRALDSVLSRHGSAAFLDGWSAVLRGSTGAC